MGKLDELKRGAGGNVAESTGAGVSRRPLAEGISVPIGGARFKDLTKSKSTFEVPVDKIVPDPNQPRKIFTPDELQDLSDSIRARGLLQPIRVRWDEAAEKWMIIAGERRWRAAGLAGLRTIVAVEARAAQTTEELLEDQLVENCVREDLKPIEQATAFRALMESRGWSYRELGEFLHISKGKVAKAMALLSLPEPVKDLVEQGTLAPHAAYEITRLEDADDQREVAERVVAQKLTAEEAAREVKSRKLGIKSPEPRETPSPAPAEPPASIRKDRPKTIKVEVRPGIVATVQGISNDAEAIEALKEAAAILKRRLKDRAA